MKVSKKYLIVVVLLLMAVINTGCYWWEQLEPSEYGAKMDAGKITECVGPGGQYSDSGIFADLQHISAATLTFEVSDAEVLTLDNQPVGITITIQARRNAADCDQLKNLVESWPGLLDDSVFIETIDATAKEGIKNGTRGFTLPQLLNDRNLLAKAITEHIEADATRYSGDLINVTIENVAVDPDYVQVLTEQARYTAEIDKEKKRQELVRQKAETDALEQEQRTQVYDNQLEAEKALTIVQVEIASRKGKVIAAENEVYLLNEPAFQLERLARLQQIFGNKSVFYFLDPNLDLTLFFTPGSAIPVPVTQPGEPPVEQ